MSPMPKCVRNVMCYLDNFAKLREEHLYKNDDDLAVHDDQLPVERIGSVSVVQETIFSLEGLVVQACLISVKQHQSISWYSEA